MSTATHEQTMDQKKYDPNQPNKQHGEKTVIHDQQPIKNNQNKGNEQASGSSD